MSAEWAAVGLLGAAHGVNPAMGWLLAVGMGLQDRSRRAVWKALGPMAVGHALAIGVVVGLAAALDLVMPPALTRWAVAGALIAMGVLHFRGHRHAAGGGMRVRGAGLVAWSFLVASGHGAGLMVLPFALGGDHGAHAGHVAAGAGAGGLVLTSVHSAGYLLATGLIAVLVYERMGLGFLRWAWLNLDLIWGGALVATGLLTLVL